MDGDEAASVMYMGIKISNVNYNRTYQTLRKIIGEGGKGYVCLSDVGNVITATQDEQLRAAINESTFSLADGMPLARFAQLVGCSEIERISGVRLMKKMLSEDDGFKHLLLGDTEETISSVISEAKRMNQNVKITGHSPPFKSFAEEDNKKVLKLVQQENPDVIWVSLGGGKQEKWMHQHFEKIDRGVMIGVGAAFRWLIGQIPMPPEFIQNLGLQWAYRLVHEFTHDPVQAAKRCRQRRLIKNKLVFLANLPTQVSAARRHLRQSMLSASGGAGNGEF